MIKLYSLILVLLIGGSFSLWAEDWTHWRGPNQNGSSQEQNLPNRWEQQGENLLWHAPYGARTAPLVMDGRVFLINSAGEGENLQERVLALEENTGRFLWEHRFNVFHTDIVANRLGWANLAGDPETGYIYAHGVQGMFFCFSSEGEVVWSRSLTEEFGRISGYGGRTNSPLVTENLVIISFLNSGWNEHGRALHRYMAMDKKTGEVVWWSAANNKPLDTTYSVPVLTTINGVKAFVTGCADGGIYAFKVATGEILWSFQLSKRGINSSVVVADGVVYACHSEENIDNAELGRVVAIDGTQQGEITESGELWRLDGLAVGYASPILYQDLLFVMDNSANLHCIDRHQGEILWSYNYGKAAKGSGVYGDGKIYVGETSGEYHILQVSRENCQLLDKESFRLANGSPIEINGSPAIANGKVLLPTKESLYCLAKQPQPTHLQVIPAESWVEPGEKVNFRAFIYDQQGNRLRQVHPQWQIKDLQGTISAQGVFTTSQSSQQAGYVSATFEELSATSRLRVVPPLPYAENFNDLPVGSPPPGWITSKLKCQVAEHEGEKVLWKLANRSAPPFARLKAYIQPPISGGYTIQADMKGMPKKFYLPDMGLINSRYTVILMGTSFSPQIRLVTWDPMPRLQKDQPFDWKPQEWYRVKLRVKLKEDHAVIQGKAWPRSQPEPKKWTITMKDPSPNVAGSPGIYAYSVGATDESTGTEVYFDNVQIYHNQEETAK